MKTVDEELKLETVETLDLRGDIGFLLKDEVEAIDGYDRVLKRAELTEEQKNMLEEIRNDELEHVDKLNEIYRTLATGEIEEGNDIVKYNKDSKIKDYKSNELIAHIRELYKTIGKDKIEQYKEILKKKGGYRDLGTRLAWDALHVATHNAGERMSDWYDKYEVNDNHIDSAAKKVLREMGVSLVDANRVKDEDPIQKIVGRKLKTALDVLDLVKIYLGNYKWHNNPDGTMTVSTDAGKYIIKFKYEPKNEENLERVVVSNVTKIEDDFTGAEFKEANVNEPLNPMCDEEVEDGFLENVLSKGLGVVNNMVNQLDEDTAELELGDDIPVEEQIKRYLKENGRSAGRLKLVGISQPEIEVYLDNEFIGKWNREKKQMGDSAEMVEQLKQEAIEAHERLTDTDTSNDIGFIEKGNQYRWEEKYGNTLLTVLKTDTEIRLALDRNGAYVEIPREKFEEMIRSGKLKAVESVNIEEYSDIETLKDYKVKVGDKTFVVSAKSPKDAKNKVKSKLGE